MTVLDNILLGRHRHMRAGVLAGGLFWGRSRREETAHRRRVEEIIEFLELERCRKELVASLPFGVQKLVAIGRALAMEPTLLLLDEPSTGMNREEKENLARFLLRIKHELAMTMLWVEHDMELVGDLADSVTVLDFGEKIAEGPPDVVLRDARVAEAYLGRAARAERGASQERRAAADVGGGKPRASRLGVACARGDGGRPPGRHRRARADGGRDPGGAPRPGARRRRRA